MRRKGHYLNFNAVGCKPPLEHEHQRTGDTGSSPRRQPSGAPNLAVLFLESVHAATWCCINTIASFSWGKIHSSSSNITTHTHFGGKGCARRESSAIQQHILRNQCATTGRAGVPYVHIPKNIFTNVRSPTARGIGFVFVSGQVPVDSNGKYLPVESSVTKKTHQVIQNVSSILGASGTSLDQVSKANVYFVQLDRNISRNTARCRS
ncbi:hypothetical protein N7524_003517 [Penicillium chrysogenum]|nr:hypothetical protein N7524_003517 [Penicillium chrysogenum]